MAAEGKKGPPQFRTDIVENKQEPPVANTQTTSSTQNNNIHNNNNQNINSRPQGRGRGRGQRGRGYYKNNNQYIRSYQPKFSPNNTQNLNNSQNLNNLNSTNNTNTAPVPVQTTPATTVIPIQSTQQQTATNATQNIISNPQQPATKGKNKKQKNQNQQFIKKESSQQQTQTAPPQQVPAITTQPQVISTPTIQLEHKNKSTKAGSTLYIKFHGPPKWDHYQVFF